jgi:hypothetical protein
MDVEAPTGGYRQIRGFSPEKTRTFHQRQPDRALPKGVVPSPLGRWPWKAHHVAQDAYDVIQHLWTFWEAIMARVASWRRPMRANVLLQQATFALERANVTLERA